MLDHITHSALFFVYIPAQHKWNAYTLFFCIFSEAWIFILPHIFISLVPQTTANVNLLGIVNITSVNISLDSIPPNHFCGDQKYIVIKVVDVKDDLTRRTNLKNVSKMTNKSSLDTGYKTYQINLTYNIEINQYVRNSSLCNVSTDHPYLQQSISLTHMVDGLNYFTNYSIMVYLCNELGCGNSSKPVTFETDEYTPLCPPANVRFINTTSTSVVLKWSDVPVKCANGIITGYNISLMRMRFLTKIKRYTTNKGMVFEGLAKYEYFCAKVVAFTYLGSGPYSKPICTHTNEGRKYL